MDIESNYPLNFKHTRYGPSRQPDHLQIALFEAMTNAVESYASAAKLINLVHEMLPGTHFATVYAKPKGRDLVDTFITEVSQDT